MTTPPQPPPAALPADLDRLRGALERIGRYVDTWPGPVAKQVALTVAEALSPSPRPSPAPDALPEEGLGEEGRFAMLLQEVIGEANEQEGLNQPDEGASAVSNLLRYGEQIEAALRAAETLHASMMGVRLPYKGQAWMRLLDLGNALRRLRAAGGRHE